MSKEHRDQTSVNHECVQFHFALAEEEKFLAGNKMSEWALPTNIEGQHQTKCSASYSDRIGASVMKTEAVSAVEIINMHLNRHYEADQRADAVVEMLLENEISSADFWPLLQALWGGFKKIDHTMFVHAMDAEKRKSCWIPTAQWHQLPREISVYRGQSLGKEVGLSWTTSFDTALDYAIGCPGLAVKTPIILETRIPKSSVAMVVEKGEANELVLWKAPQISDCLITQVSSVAN